MFVNLYNIDNMLKNVKSAQRRIESLVELYHKSSKGTIRSIIALMVQRKQVELDIAKREYLSQLFESSDYGLAIKNSNGGYYKILIKGEADRTILNTLYRNENREDFESYYEPLTARMALKYAHSMDLPSIKISKIIELLEVEARKELMEFMKSNGWTKSGLSVFAKDQAWLHVGNKLPKIGMFKDGELLQDGIISWNGVNFKKSRDYDNHSAPRNWILGSTGLTYPISYAKEKNIPIRLPQPSTDSTYVAGKCNDLNLSYSHSCGYYDADKYSVVAHTLVSESNRVIVNNGGVTSDEYEPFAIYLPRHGYHVSCRQNSVLMVNNQMELRSECVHFNGLWYHRNDHEIDVCRSCGNTDLRENFRSLGDDDENVVCTSCVDQQTRQLNKMCYSTDVLDHKGFGSTNTRINGNPIYVGLELEVYADFNESNKRDVVLGLNKFATSKSNTYCVATHDGSLCSTHGVEYIFRPEGLNQQKLNVHDFVSKNGKFLSEDAGNGYGLHIHVSSQFLTELDRNRIVNFISVFEKYFRHFGKRNKTEYQEAKHLGDNSDLNYYDDSKYRMVNIGKSTTIEYRFPKSLVDEVHINMNLELALAVTMFCKYNLSTVALDMTKCSPKALRKFIQYVAANKKQYPLLNAENNANIDLNHLEKYSKLYTPNIKVFDSEHSVYALCA